MDQSVAVRQRKAPKPRQVEEDVKNAKEARPDQVEKKDNESSGDKLSAMDKLCRRMRKKLRTTTNSDASTTLNAMEFLHNPQSFTQTVENIFTYGFLVKKGEGSFKIDSEGNWILGSGDGASIGNEERPTQAVCSFTMADWRRMNEQHSEACMMGHR